MCSTRITPSRRTCWLQPYWTMVNSWWTRCGYCCYATPRSPTAAISHSCSGRSIIAILFSQRGIMRAANVYCLRRIKTWVAERDSGRRTSPPRPRRKGPRDRNGPFPECGTEYFHAQRPSVRHSQDCQERRAIFPFRGRKVGPCGRRNSRLADIMPHWC